MDRVIPRGSFIRFILVGIINSAVGGGIMFVMYNLGNFSYGFSSLCNYIAGGILSYFLNKFFTFRDKSKTIKQFILFSVNVIVCYVLGYSLSWLVGVLFFSNVQEVLRGNISLLFGMFFYTVLNYIGQRFLVFRGLEV